jgi:hypothetical protein
VVIRGALFQWLMSVYRSAIRHTPKVFLSEKQRALVKQPITKSLRTRVVRNQQGVLAPQAARVPSRQYDQYLVALE